MQVHPRALFSAHPASGNRTRKRAKYKRDAICPIMMYGSSTGIPPIQVKMTTSAMRVQNRSCERGRNVSPRCFDVWRMGTTMRIRIEARRASTPPSLFGIERRMA